MMGVITSGVSGRRFGIFLFGERRPFDVGDVKPPARRIVNKRAREPADWKEPFEFGFLTRRFEVDHRDGVLRAVGDVEAFAIGRKGESIGRSAEKVCGAGFDPDGFDDLICFGVDDAEVVTASVRNDKPPCVRRKGERGRMEMNEDFGFGFAGSEIDDRDGSFVGDIADGIDFDDGAASDRAHQIAGARTPTAPITHVSFTGGENDIIGSDADWEGARDFASGEIDFEKLIGKIGADIKFSSVGRKGETCGNFFFAAKSVGVRKRDGMGWSDFAVGDSEDFDASVDVG